jgi:hypothetical protein
MTRNVCLERTTVCVVVRDIISRNPDSVGNDYGGWWVYDTSKQKSSPERQWGDVAVMVIEMWMMVVDGCWPSESAMIVMMSKYGRAKSRRK